MDAATTTPSRRTISAEAPSSRRAVHTPLDRSASRDLLNSVRHRTPASGARRPFNNAPTPHAKAARKALDKRRNAMFTPGKNRRRSLREQRETPMGILRNLGRALAPQSRPIHSSSSPGDKTSSSIAPIPEEDEDDELPIDRPRLSLPLDEDDDDESDLLPPRSSGLEEENYTVQSIELPRRAISEQPGGRLSFGSARMSDIFGNDHTLDLGRQSDFFPGLLEDLEARGAADFSFERYVDLHMSFISKGALDGLLTMKPRIEMDPTRRTTMGRESDFGLQMPAGLDEQTTFMLSEPGLETDVTSPIREPSIVGPTANEVSSEKGGDLFDNEYPDMAGVDSDSVGGEIEVPEAADLEPSKRSSKIRKKHKRISRHGIEYPPLPPAFVKRVAQTALQSSGLSNSRISADTLTALTQASEWYFEQLGDDLGAYANHAKRKTIEESDVLTLMRRYVCPFHMGIIFGGFPLFSRNCRLIN